MKRFCLTYYLAAFLVLLLGVVVFSVGTGYYRFASGNAYTTLWKMISGDTTIAPGERYIAWDVRTARVIMGVLTGSMLAVSGTLLQGMFRNPLATGDLIGLNSVATLLASFAIVLGNLFSSFLPELVRQSLVSISAFAGALFAMMLVYRIATGNGKTNVVMMLLSGVAITSVGFAITGFLIYLAQDDQLRDLTFWNLGSLAGATWTKNIILATVLALSYVFLIGKGKTLNAIMLGEKDAQHLGIDVEEIKKKIVFFTALMIGSCVAFSGTIGFVGLIVPYILRFLFKSDYQYILPLSALSGGILLVLADTFCRTLLAPSELPIGILTALMGGPVFIAILLKYKNTLR